MFSIDQKKTLKFRKKKIIKAQGAASLFNRSHRSKADVQFLTKDRFTVKANTGVLFKIDYFAHFGRQQGVIIFEIYFQT